MRYYVHAQKYRRTGSLVAGKDTSRLESENMGKSVLLHPEGGRGVQDDES